MKRIILTSAVAAMTLAACTSQSEIVKTPSVEGDKASAPISFTTVQRNVSRSATPLNMAKHYNFGVFGYKNNDDTHDILSNYLVGYYDPTYAYDSHEGCTTWGDQEELVEGMSYWMYEAMGSAEYQGNYAGSPITAKYQSNHANQYLRFWDEESDYTCFYAYAPYINGAGTATFNNSTKVLSIPDGSIEAAYDNPTDYEFMYAATQVDKTDYGHDVPLVFKRINALVNIKFWEDIKGYTAEILDLSATQPGVYAAPAKRTGEGTTASPYQYAKAKYYEKSGISIDFSNISQPVPSMAAGTTTQVPLCFVAPVGVIAESRDDATPSPTSYYAIPKGNGDTDCGFTFHVTYRLTSTTGETLTVKNATVHVPADVANWKSNTAYTYIFRITKNSNGTTGTIDTIDPTDPDVSPTPALYPIVFDKCTVSDWDKNESDYNISD